jgi:hypothetical protein
VDVVSMSMGGVASRAWAEVVNRAYDKGIVMVTAAGNNFPLTPESIVYPARFRRVIAACGVMADGRPYIRDNVGFRDMAGNYGPDSKMDTALAAYTPNMPWAEINCRAIVDMDGSGTSSATPQIAAAAALWLQKQKPAMNGWQGWEQVEAARNALFQSADKGSPESRKYFGQGILRAARALGEAPVRGLRKQDADTARASFWKIITGRGIAVEEVNSEMLPVEAMQLFHLDRDVAKSIDDPETLKGDPPDAYYDAVLGSPFASKTLKKALSSRFHAAAVPGANLGKPAPPERPRNSQILTPKPAVRRLRVYAFDPSLSMDLETARLNEITLSVPWELLDPGPSGDYIEVVDHDPATGCYYAPVDLNDQKLLAGDGLKPDAANPHFHQQMVYAVSMRTIRNFERALGRKALWAPQISENSSKDEKYVRKLRIYPHALRESNAFYDPEKKALLFGYFPARRSTRQELYAGGIVFTCLSHDVVAHETTHALLDGMHRNFNLEGSLDMLAFHEAFADMVALFQHFSLPEVLRFEVTRTRGDLNMASRLAEIGQEFGRAVGLHQALRSALGHTPDPAKLDAANEPHDRGAILVAAVFQAFLLIYARRTGDLLRIATSGTGVLPIGAIHPDLVNRLADEAAKAAQHVLTICIRALDYCPPVDLTFGDYLRALITADYQVVPDDDLDYRVAFVEAFRKWGIYPGDVPGLSPAALLWRPTQFAETSGVLNEIFRSGREFTQEVRYLADNPAFGKHMPVRQRLFEFTRKWRARFHSLLEKRIAGLPEETRLKLGVDLGLDLSTGREKFEVHALRVSEKAGPEGDIYCQMILQLLQSRAERAPGRAVFRFHGGCTLIVDETNLEVKYSITKNIGSQARLENMRQSFEKSHSLQALYFDGTPFYGGAQRFAVLHQME